MALTKDILPNCIAQRSEKTIVWPNGQKLLPLFCANCGKEGGLVFEIDWDRVKNFAFYLCDPCGEKWSHLADVALSPDEVFWKTIHEIQLDEFGRDLTDAELVEALKDDNHILTKVCKDRYDPATLKT